MNYFLRQRIKELNTTICFSEPWVDKKPVASQHIHLQLENVQNNWCSLQTGWSLDRRQATHITFICPMLFDSFPLDTQRCKFQVERRWFSSDISFTCRQVGSYSYDMNRMVFDVSTLGYIQNTQSIILDYEIFIRNLKKSDKIFEAGALGNFSLAGFEMVRKSICLNINWLGYWPT